MLHAARKVHAPAKAQSKKKPHTKRHATNKTHLASHHHHHHHQQQQQPQLVRNLSTTILTADTTPLTQTDGGILLPDGELGTFHTPHRVKRPTDKIWTTDELRASFLDYFKSKGHTHLPSAGVVPHNDPSLLFTAAGMVPFKNVFLGIEQPPQNKTRVTTAQRCVRAGGKHNDLDNVGYTARHHTYFEMLGNFSFGDYFKEEAITFAWDYLTNVLQLPKDRLMVSVFETDDEAAAIWAKVSGFSEANGTIRRMGAEDNFWQMGDVGPCGPCSEIYFDQQREIDGEQFLEIWNLVFMQYNRQENGDLHPLENKCVDTGMGLERLAAVMQGVQNNFDNDVFLNMVNNIGTTAINENHLQDFAMHPNSFKKHHAHITNPKELQIAEAQAKLTHEQRITATRVITDHMRAIISMLYDGVQPSSQSRGYVLRRILRRACRYGLQLGYNTPFMYTHVEEMVKLMEKAIPGISQHAKQLRADVFREEKLFSASMNKGMKMIQDFIGKNNKDIFDEYGVDVNTSSSLSGVGGEDEQQQQQQQQQQHTISPQQQAMLKQKKQFPVDLAFQLYDAHGFPIDLTELCVKDLGYTLDTAAVEDLLLQRKKESREIWQQNNAKGGAAGSNALTQQFIDSVFDIWRSEGNTSMFVGYEKTFVENTKILGVVKVGDVDVEKNKQTVMLMLEECPFYPTGGGQVSDTGSITIRIPKHIITRPDPTTDPLAAKTKKDEHGNKLYHDTITLHVTNAVKHHSGEMIGLVAELDLTTAHNLQIDPDAVLQILQNPQDFENDTTNVKIAKNNAKGKQWLNKLYTSASVDANIRDQTSIHHTTTHLLQAALQRTLGASIEEVGDEHSKLHQEEEEENGGQKKAKKATTTTSSVKQAGSHVHHSSLRFDFAFSRPLTREEINEVETQVNAIALRHVPVNVLEMNIDEAKELGAMALFGEKYGNEVRVVSIADHHNHAISNPNNNKNNNNNDEEGMHSSDEENSFPHGMTPQTAEDRDNALKKQKLKGTKQFSVELCGGTHVKNTIECYPFVILSENGVSSGTRRIEAIAGVEASKYLQQQHKVLKNIKSDNILKIHHLAEPADVVTAVVKLKQKHDQLQTKNKELEKKQLDMMMNGAGGAGGAQDEEQLQNVNPYLSTFWSIPSGWTAQTISPSMEYPGDSKNDQKPVVVLYNVPASASEDYTTYRKFTEDVFTKSMNKYNEFMKSNDQQHIQSITHAFIGETNGKGLIYSNVTTPNKKDKAQAAALANTTVKPFGANDAWKAFTQSLPKSKGGGKPELAQGTFDLTELCVEMANVDVSVLLTKSKVVVLADRLQAQMDEQYKL